MDGIISYRPVAAPLNARIGTVSVDADGYTPLIVGALATYNSAGHFYEATDSVKDLFKASSVMQRMAKESALYGENGHPDLRGLDDKSAMSRFIEIYEPNVCAHFAEVYLDENFYKTSPTLKQGEIAIIANTKAYGDKAAVVSDALINPRMNLCFSIRCLSRNRMVGKTLFRTIVSVITFDKVYLPGIRHATKLNAISNSELDRKGLETSLEKMAVTANTETFGDIILSMEQSHSFSTESISHAKGIWREIEQDQQRYHLEPTTLRSGLDILTQPWTAR